MVIDINWAMYEACEYFESASRNYAKGFYKTGDSEIDLANKKIAKHDSMIREYNRYISKIKVLEENIWSR